MTVQEIYDQAKAPFQNRVPYWNMAGKLVLERFKNFDEIKMQNFFEFLAQVHQERSNTYQYFFKNQADIRAGRGVLPENRLRALIFVMPKFLDTADQVTLLRYELLNHLQNNKVAITRNFTLKAGVQNAFDVYSKFLAVIYYLARVPSTWFSELAYEPQDRHELIEALMYIQILKLKASVSHFKKDILLVSEKARNLSKSILYFIDFLGIEVKVVGKEYDLNRLDVYDEVYLPTFAGKFAPLLNQYMTDELAQEDYQVVLREMQESVLAHDLGKAIQHYKNHNTLTSRADINFALRGGAGIVRLDIRSWINRLLVGDFNKVFLVSLTLLVTGVFVSLSIWFEKSIFMSIPITLMILLSNNNSKNEAIGEDAKHQERALDLAYLREPYEKHYHALVHESRKEKEYILLNHHLLDNLRQNLQNICFNQAIENIHDGYFSPTIMQEIYDNFRHHLRNIKPNISSFLANQEGNEQDKEECFKAAQHILDLQLISSRLHFTKLMNLLVRQKAEAIYYNYFLQRECRILHYFYEKSASFLMVYISSDAITYLSQVYDTEPHLFLTAEPTGKYATLIKDWIAQEEAMLKSNAQEITSELQKVSQYLVFLEQCRTTPHLNVQPFLFEGAEGVLLL